MSAPEVLPPEEIVVRLCAVIKEKTPTTMIEFGFDEDDNHKWWAKVTLNSGRVRMAEVKVDNVQMGPVEALAEVARELGLSVRIREPHEVTPGGGEGAA